MSSRLLAASPAFLLFAAPALASVSDLDAVLAKAMDGTQTPALAVLEMPDGKIAQEAVRGVRRNDKSDLAKISDVWATGSDGKP